MQAVQGRLCPSRWRQAPRLLQLPRARRFLAFCKPVPAVAGALPASLPWRAWGWGTIAFLVPHSHGCNLSSPCPSSLLTPRHAWSGFCFLRGH